MAGVITEIAAECGVSEQAVRAWCRRNHVAKDAKGSFAINKSQKTAIYQHYLGVERKRVSQPAKASCETCETSETALISMLQKELDRKNEQLSVKDKQIEELNARLAEVSSALVGDGTADCGSGPGSPCGDDPAAASYRWGWSGSAEPKKAGTAKELVEPAFWKIEGRSPMLEKSN